MATLGYIGFTITLTRRRDGDPRSVLIWAGGGTEAITVDRLYDDLERVIHEAQDKDVFKHWSEVWER